MANNNALAVRNTALAENPAGFGNKHAISAVRDRIMSMMPGAATAPPDVVWAAAQLAVAYKLDPFNGEIYIMKIGSRQVNGQWVDDYRAHVGVKGLRKKAREQAQFMTEFRDLSPEEVKIARRGDYDPGDVGVECTLWRLDIAQQCARLNIPYKPFKATGYWRVKAQFRRKDQKWEPDGIPNTWTAHDVAEKRAEINAIKRAYDLTIDVADPAAVNDEDTVEVIGHRIASHDRDRAGFIERDAEPDTVDGDVLFYHDDLPAVDVVEIDAEESDDLLGDPGVHDAVKGFVEKLRAQDDPSARKATDKQHKFAVGVIDGITGKGSHRLVFQAIFGREVTGEAPLSNGAAQMFFEYLCRQKSVKADDGTVSKVENEKYDPTCVEFVGEIYKWASVYLANVDAEPEPVAA